MARKYFIETFGCQMNYHDSERLAGLLEADGYERTDERGAAPTSSSSTPAACARRAEDKLYTRLGEIARARGGDADVDPIIAVTGCVAQQEGERLLKRDSSIDVIVGTQSLKSPAATASRRRANAAAPPSTSTRYDDVSFPLGVARHSDPVRAWVTIIEGCNEFCAFCVVPYTRGHERMRPVARHPRRGARGGRPGRGEVQLLGQIVNHYQAPDDPACDFAELLARVSAVPGIAADSLREPASAARDATG